MLSDHDKACMQQALALAQRAIGLTEPNPRVGCVLADASGRQVGAGHTQEAGGAHAEVMALREAHAAGATLHGGSAWVTLEPCSHHGRTPPCTQALIEAGIARVVVACNDPNPLVCGGGVAALRQAGVEVVMAGAGAARASRELNIGFFSRMLRRRPWVRLKSATSLDGTTALPNGASQWITGEQARADGHAWRRRAGAVLTGVGTVLADNPRLDVRLVSIARQPLRVVVDSSLRTPLDARVLCSPASALLATLVDAADARAQRLAQRGATISTHPAQGGRVDLQYLVEQLAQRGVNELHVEAGATLSAAFLQAGLVDELLVYLAPLLLGPGRPMAALEPVTQLAQGLRLEFREFVLVGEDLRVLARLPGRDRFLDSSA